jgi:hypothetical protein
MAKRLIALLVVCLTACWAFTALAQADTTDIIEPQNEPPSAKDGWQAGTCEEDEPEPGVKCSPETPEDFFVQAAGHAPEAFTQYIIQHTTIAPGLLEPIKEPLEGRAIKTLRVDLPPGLTVNPQATGEGEQCSLAEFLHSPTTGVFEPECESSTQVGHEEAFLVTNENNVEFPPGSSNIIANKGSRLPLIPGIFDVPVYNLQPKPGEPALFGFVVAKQEPVFLETEVAWESDFHEAFTISLFPASSSDLQTLMSRLVNFGRSGDGTYLTNPTTCFDPNQFPHLYSTWFRAESFEEPDPEFPNGSTPVEAKVADSAGNLIQQEGCENVPFDPGVEVDPGTNAIDSPAGATVNTTLEYPTGGENLGESHLRTAEETLPATMGLNPSGAQGLKACSDAQFKKGVRVYDNECPPESKVGTVEIETPPLLKGTLKGDVYVGEQKSSDPMSGEEFRILVEAKSEERGIDVRLIGNVKASPTTGQLTAVFDEQEVSPLAGNIPHGLPQVPFTSVKIHFDGSKAVLTSPATCSAAKTTGQMEPWARPGEKVGISSEFTLSSDPNGGSCPKSLAERKFVPSYKANTDSNKGGSYSPFRVHIGRTDGQQELKVVDVTLPKGLTGKLAGIPYCSEAAIAAAAGTGGKAELAHPSCDQNSLLGSAETVSGTGSNPLHLTGQVYLAGPYKGAPLSLVVVTPAVAGPFDLGTVVVRVALNVEPETGQIHAVSDVIPDVFGGVKLDLRAINLNIDRNQFMLNPTNCAAQATTGAINGGGSDPTNPAAFSSYAVNDPFAATECNGLGFKPKLKVKLNGPTKRNKFPRLTATLKARNGDANIARTALTMPHTLFLEQGHIGTVCTRPDLAAHTCPKASVYGTAEAKSPLLDQPLKGKVLMVPSTHKLPDLLVDLRGQVEIYLRGVVGSKHGGLKTVFTGVPDLPVSKFVLKMKGGKKSLLVNSDNLCRKTQRAVLNIGGQNGKKVKNNKFKLNVASCKGKKHKKHHK